MTEPPNECLVIEWSGRVVSSDHSFYHPVLDFSKYSNELF
jgi:hypothetical protein